VAKDAIPNATEYVSEISERVTPVADIRSSTKMAMPVEWPGAAARSRAMPAASTTQP